jgi:DNA repair exonuclease SbcCD nuclease subunit
LKKSTNSGVCPFIKIGIFSNLVVSIFSHLVSLNRKFDFGFDLGFEFGEEAYEIEKFDGLETVLCGDIHKRAEFPIKNGKGYMIGSTIQNNIGESIGRHGYGVYDVETKEYTYTDLFNPRPFLKFEIKSFEDIENGTERLKNL